jgi:hypothetical protein
VTTFYVTPKKSQETLNLATYKIGLPLPIILDGERQPANFSFRAYQTKLLRGSSAPSFGEFQIDLLLAVQEIKFSNVHVNGPHYDSLRKRKWLSGLRENIISMFVLLQEVQV